jgi:hypothetical protein
MYPIPQMIMCTVGLACAIALGMLGHSYLGWAGVAAGVPAGLFGGIFTCMAFNVVFSALSAFDDRNQQRLALAQRFGKYWSSDKSDEWNTLLTKLSVGEQIQGQVVHRFTNEAIVDTGNNFPAKLYKWDPNGGITPLPEVGAKASAYVHGFDDKEHVIKLTRNDASQSAS